MLLPPLALSSTVTVEVTAESIMTVTKIVFPAATVPVWVSVPVVDILSIDVPVPKFVGLFGPSTVNVLLVTDPAAPSVAVRDLPSPF